MNGLCKMFSCVVLLVALPTMMWPSASIAQNEQPDSSAGAQIRTQVYSWKVQLDFKSRLLSDQELRTRVQAFVFETIQTGFDRLRPFNPGLVEEVQKRLLNLKSVDYLIHLQEAGSTAGIKRKEYASTSFLDDPLEIETHLQWESAAGILAGVFKSDFPQLFGINHSRYLLLQKAVVKGDSQSLSAVQRLLEREKRTAQNSIFHELFHQVGLDRSILSKHGRIYRDEDPIYACLAQVFPDDVLMMRKPSGKQTAYARTKTSCETCVRSYVQGSQILISKEEVRATQLCQHLPEGDLDFDPSELQQLKLSLGLDSEIEP